MNGQVDTQTDRWTNGKVSRRQKTKIIIDRHSDRMMDSWRDRQTNRQTVLELIVFVETFFDHGDKLVPRNSSVAIGVHLPELTSHLPEIGVPEIQILPVDDVIKLLYKTFATIGTTSADRGINYAKKVLYHWHMWMML